MDHEKMLKATRAAAEGVIAVSILTAALTIGGELFAPLKNTLKEVFTHHWLGKSALAIILFGLVFGIRFTKNTSSEGAQGSLRLAIWSSLFSAFAMSTFFALHTFGLF